MRLSRDLALARMRLIAIFGPDLRRTAVLACASRDCERRLGGRGPVAITHSVPGISVIRLAPEGRTPVILAHELAHAVVHGRAGVRALMTSRLPAWFDEGLAVIASEDPRFLGAARDGERFGLSRCIGAPGEDLPVHSRDWLPFAARNRGAPYAAAACRVLGWMADHGGWDGVLAALAEMRAGGRPVR